MIALVDYGASNLKSVAKAIAYLGYQARVTSSPQEVEQARAVVLPGVGAARATVEGLEQSGLGAAIRRVVAQGRPFLGLCVGLQVLFTTSQEGGGCPCLDILPGEVVRLPAGLKVPHIGWNRVWQRQPHPIYEGIPDGAYFYFVHSYYASPRGPEMVAGETEYGVTFPSVIIRDNLVATQFHPEKSGQVGLRLYHNFLSQVS
ncbi:MAG: imidazole glycerol phosphate synthase subunit HisH [Dehalococcoidia bacterium]